MRALFVALLLAQRLSIAEATLISVVLVASEGKLRDSIIEIL